MGDRGKGHLGSEELEYKDVKFTTSLGFSSFTIPNTSCGGDGGRKGKKRLRERKISHQMNQSFLILQSMVPNLNENCKITQEVIVQETINYIKYLSEKVARLENLRNLLIEKQQIIKPFAAQKYSNSSVDVLIARNVDFFVIQRPGRRGLLTQIMKVFEKHKAEVLEASFQVNDHNLMQLTANLLTQNGSSSNTVDRIREEILKI